MLFRTVKNFSQGIYKEQKSEFLSFIYPCATQEEADNIVRDYKKKYNNARHVCWALSLLENFTDFSDDGEPSGSAGSCILNQLRSLNLQNILVIVVRYFGGVKLGLKNLTEAYRQSFLDALQQNTTVEEETKIIKELALSEQAYQVFNFLRKQKIEFRIEDKKIKFELTEVQEKLFEDFIKGV